jgi:transposase-like protein
MEMKSIGLANGLSGNLWPMHIKPEEDELLSSWLTRLALAHGFRPYSFTSLIMGGRDLWASDIDKIDHIDLFLELAKRTNTLLSRVRVTSLINYTGLLFENISSNGHVTWITKTDKVRFSRRQIGLQFCPECLSEDTIPYFRRHWRLAFVTVCTKHCVPLLDQCPKCYTPINFYRINPQDHSIKWHTALARCFSCKADLRLRTIDSKISNQVKPKEVEFQEFLLNGLKDGWIETSSNEIIFSSLFFAGLHQLARVLITGSSSSAIREAVINYYDLQEPNDLYPKKLPVLESLRAPQRRFLFQMIQRLLNNWPDGFIDFCRANKFWSRFWFMHPNVKPLPFWYWKVVHYNLTKYKYLPTNEEFSAALNFIKKNGEAPDRHQLSKYFSRGVYERRMKEQGLSKKASNDCVCPRCKSRQHQQKAGFTLAGSRKFHCRLCKRWYTPQPKRRGHPETTYYEAVRLRREGLSYKRIANLLSVTPMAVFHWVKDYGNINTS